MDKKTIFVKTSKGEDEVTSKTSHLYGDIKRTLGLVDNKSTLTQLTKRAAPSLRESINDVLQKLIDDGFLREEVDLDKTVKIQRPGMSGLKVAKPAANARGAGEDLDFTVKAKQYKGKSVESESEITGKAEAAARIKQEEEAKLRAEEARLLEAAKARMELAAEQAKLKEEMEARARAEAIAAQRKAEREAARYRVEMAAAKAREKAEAEAKAKAEAEVKAKAEAEAARIKAEQEAARIKAKQDEAKARAEAELARLKAEKERIKIQAAQELAKAREKSEADARALAEEAARIKLEREAARAKVELERQREEAEDEARVRAEIAADYLKAEQEEAKILAELEAQQVEQQAGSESESESESNIQPVGSTSPEQFNDSGKFKPLTDDVAGKQAEAQAKLWVNAEQRAKEQVAVQAKQVEAPPLGQEKAKVQPIEATPRTIRERSKPLPWGKLSLGLVALLLLLAAFLPYVWPMQEYVRLLEQKLTVQLQRPVHIGQLQLTLLPQPKLELQDLIVGSSKDFTADKVTVIFGVTTLFSESKVISKVEIDKPTFNPDTLESSLPMLQIAAGDVRYPVKRIEFKYARFGSEALSLPLLNGTLDFDKQGNVRKAVLGSEDRRLSVKIQPQQSRWQVEVAIRDGSLPILPGINFKELNASGKIDANGAEFYEMDGDIYGGRIVGSASLTWQNGWQLQGKANIKTMSLPEALPQIDVTGDLDGDVKFALRGDQPHLMSKAPRLEGNVVVKNGKINKIDMVESSRMSSRQGAAPGRTHFDQLNGTLLVENSSLQLRAIKIAADVLSASGNIDVAADGELSGRLGVDLKMRAEIGSVPLVLSGTITEPVWNIGR